MANKMQINDLFPKQADGSDVKSQTLVSSSQAFVNKRGKNNLTLSTSFQPWFECGYIHLEATVRWALSYLDTFQPKTSRVVEAVMTARSVTVTKGRHLL